MISNLVIISAEIEPLDAFINGLALRAILEPDGFSAECQLSELRRDPSGKRGFSLEKLR